MIALEHNMNFLWQRPLICTRRFVVAHLSHAFAPVVNQHMVNEGKEDATRVTQRCQRHPPASLKCVCRRSMKALRTHG
jgi:hypothetical protein